MIVYGRIEVLFLHDISVERFVSYLRLLPLLRGFRRCEMEFCQANHAADLSSICGPLRTGV